MTIFNQTNLLLQGEDRCIYATDKELNSSIECLGGKFLKLDQLTQAGNVFGINIKDQKQP